jgi:serine/threonine-protein kinase
MAGFGRRHARCKAMPVVMNTHTSRENHQNGAGAGGAGAAGPAGSVAIGTVLRGTYRIVRRLAEGGCGEVYLAAHTRLPGKLAIKVLRRDLIRNPEALSRFRQEAEITSTLRHPNIVQVFDFDVTDSGFPYLVMELIDGELLTHRIAESGPLGPQATLRIVEQIARALHAAHTRGIVHRDLKPDNVMLVASTGVQDFVKVLDFGISQASGRPRLTAGACVAGTPQYMAPEQACALREQIDHRTDQFSLAAIAYTMLTGQEAFPGDDPVDVLYLVVHTDPVPPAEVLPGVGAAASAVIMRGLAKASADRYPDVMAFAEALRAAVGAPPSLRVVSDGAPLVPAPPAPPAVAFAASAPGDDDAGPPPVRAPAPHLALVAAAPSRVDLDAATMPVGRDTVRLIRRMRWRLHRVPRRVALVALAAGAALAWFSPATRAPARAAWHRAEAQVQRVIGRAARGLVVPTL